MTIPWAAIGAITSIASLGSGIYGAGQNKLQAQTQGAISVSNRRTTGRRQIGDLALGATLSGVEVSNPDVAGGSGRIGYSRGKAGFLGIGKKEGGKIENSRDYSGASDTTSIVLGTSRDATRLDVSAIGLNANNAGRAYGIQAFNAGLSTFARTAGFLDTLLAPGKSGSIGGTGIWDKFTYFGSGLGS